MPAFGNDLVLNDEEERRRKTPKALADQGIPSLNDAATKTAKAAPKRRERLIELNLERRSNAAATVVREEGDAAEFDIFSAAALDQNQAAQTIISGATSESLAALDKVDKLRELGGLGRAFKNITGFTNAFSLENAEEDAQISGIRLNLLTQAEGRRKRFQAEELDTLIRKQAGDARTANARANLTNANINAFAATNKFDSEQITNLALIAEDRRDRVEFGQKQSAELISGMTNGQLAAGLTETLKAGGSINQTLSDGTVLSMTTGRISDEIDRREKQSIDLLAADTALQAGNESLAQILTLRAFGSQSVKGLEFAQQQGNRLPVLDPKTGQPTGAFSRPVTNDEMLTLMEKAQELEAQQVEDILDINRESRQIKPMQLNLANTSENMRKRAQSMVGELAAPLVATINEFQQASNSLVFVGDAVKGFGDAGVKTYLNAGQEALNELSKGISTEGDKLFPDDNIGQSIFQSFMENGTPTSTTATTFLTGAVARGALPNGFRYGTNETSTFDAMQDEMIRLLQDDPRFEGNSFFGTDGKIDADKLIANLINQQTGRINPEDAALVNRMMLFGKEKFTNLTVTQLVENTTRLAGGINHDFSLIPSGLLTSWLTAASNRAQELVNGGDETDPSLLEAEALMSIMLQHNSGQRFTDQFETVPEAFLDLMQTKQFGLLENQIVEGDGTNFGQFIMGAAFGNTLAADVKATLDQYKEALATIQVDNILIARKSLGAYGPGTQDRHRFLINHVGELAGVSDGELEQFTQFVEGAAREQVDPGGIQGLATAKPERFGPAPIAARTVPDIIMTGKLDDPDMERIRKLLAKDWQAQAASLDKTFGNRNFAKEKGQQ